MSQPIYGIMAEFDDPTALVAASRAAYERGFRKLDAHTPIPLEELSEALHLHKNMLPLIVLCGGIIGGLTGFLLQAYITVWQFPINIGGRPLLSWPSYIVITFELTILFAAISSVFGMLALCGLPMPYHPVFNVPNFAMASRNKFFLCIESADPLYEHDAVVAFLQSFDPREVSDVAH